MPADDGRCSFSTPLIDKCRAFHRILCKFDSSSAILIITSCRQFHPSSGKLPHGSRSVAPPVSAPKSRPDRPVSPSESEHGLNRPSQDLNRGSPLLTLLCAYQRLTQQCQLSGTPRLSLRLAMASTPVALIELHHSTPVTKSNRIEMSAVPCFLFLCPK